MKTMTKALMGLLALALAACNASDGACWQRGEGGAPNPSPGPVGAQGAGGFGEGPPPAGTEDGDTGCNLSTPSIVTCVGEVRGCTSKTIEGQFSCLNANETDATENEAKEQARAWCESKLSNQHAGSFKCSDVTDLTCGTSVSQSRPELYICYGEAKCRTPEGKVICSVDDFFVTADSYIDAENTADAHILEVCNEEYKNGQCEYWMTQCELQKKTTGGVPKASTFTCDGTPWCVAKKGPDSFCVITGKKVDASTSSDAVAAVVAECQAQHGDFYSCGPGTLTCK